MKTLFVGRRLPYPPVGGAALRNLQHITALQRLGPVAAVTISLDAGPAGVGAGNGLPPGVTAGGNYVVDTGDGTKLSGYLRWLKAMRPNSHVYCDILFDRRVSASLYQVAKEFAPDLVVFAEPWLYRYMVDLKLSQARLIMDAHNVEADLATQMKRSTAGFRSQVKSGILARGTKAIERGFLRRAHQVWVCSEVDAGIMERLYGAGEKCRVIVNAVDVDSWAGVRASSVLAGGTARRVPHTVVFAGLFEYPPNADAAELLVQSIFPLICGVFPDAKLLLVGQSPTTAMRLASERDSRITVTGWVPDVRPFIEQASVAVVPLAHGGGSRIKILEAFAAGRAVVSTRKGAEGIAAEDGRHILLAESPREFESAVSRLWVDAELHRRVVEAALALVESRYSWGTAAVAVCAAVRDLDQSLALGQQSNLP